jgi:hypothetical protein
LTERTDRQSFDALLSEIERRKKIIHNGCQQQSNDFKKMRKKINIERKTKKEYKRI